MENEVPRVNKMANQIRNKKTLISIEMRVSGGLSSAPARTRTLDPVIKSHLLYQLSYKGGLGANH